MGVTIRVSVVVTLDRARKIAHSFNCTVNYWDMNPDLNYWQVIVNVPEGEEKGTVKNSAGMKAGPEEEKRVSALQANHTL